MGHAVGEATRRAVEPVRRVTARPGSSPVAASSWEHVEVVLAEDAEVVSSLVLEQDSTFRAQVFSRSGEDAKLKPLEPEQPTLGPEREKAFGCWRPCGKGVELVLAEEVDLGLEELVILYRHRRGCLVAEETSLPDGLAQEYSRCAPESEAAGATLNSVPEACCSPRSEVYEDDFEDDSEPEHQQ